MVERASARGVGGGRKAGSAPRLPAAVQRQLAAFKAAGVAGAPLSRLRELIRARCGQGAAGDALPWAEALRAMLPERKPGEAAPGAGPRVVAFVGPSGVGKTTTLAKIAGRLRTKGVTAGLVTCDTFSVGAVDQLSQYSKVMELPFRMAVGGAAGLREAVEELAGCHVVLVDTTGRNPRAPGEVQELGRLLAGAPSAEKHLVLSATTKHEDLCAAVQAFGALVVDRLVVTKLDETCTVGSVFNLLAEHPGLPPTFFGTGPQVPGDLVPATAGYLVGRVLGTVPATCPWQAVGR